MRRSKRRARRVRSCFWCERHLEGSESGSSVAFTRDHVVPRSQGGTSTVPCCRACNNLKGDMLPDEWRAYMRANPEWWKLYKRRLRSPAELRNGVPKL